MSRPTQTGKGLLFWNKTTANTKKTKLVKTLIKDAFKMLQSSILLGQTTPPQQLVFVLTKHHIALTYDESEEKGPFTWVVGKLEGSLASTSNEILGLKPHFSNDMSASTDINNFLSLVNPCDITSIKFGKTIMYNKD